MQHSRLLPSSSGSPLPEGFVSRLASFADLFTRPTWSNVLVLVAGVVLAPGRRTVTAALRILGRDCDPDFYVRRERRDFPVGDRPTRQLSLRPVGIGAVVEVTKRLKPLV